MWPENAINTLENGRKTGHLQQYPGDSPVDES